MPPKTSRVRQLGVAQTKPNRAARRSLTSGADDALIREFLWEALAAASHIAAISKRWARSLEVSGAEWLLMMAVDYLDQGDGTSVGEVSNKLHVQATFATALSKKLEKQGYLERRQDPEDGRLVLLSLTAKAKREIAKLSEKRKAVNDSIFSELPPEELRSIIERFSRIRSRLERAARILEAEDRTS